jgi:uncharacterized protein (UPF0335 family)
MMPEPQSNTISPDDFVIDFLEVQRMKRALDEASAKYRAARKRLEGKGADLKALAMVERLRKLDEEERELLTRNVARYAAWLDMPVGRQGGLFAASDDAGKPSPKTAATLSDAAIYEEGHKAGLAGRDASDHRFPAGSPAHEQFFTGWKDGQAALAARLGVDEPDEGATLKPPSRGRPKKGVEQVEARPAGPQRRRGGRRSSAAL